MSGGRHRQHFRALLAAKVLKIKAGYHIGNTITAQRDSSPGTHGHRKQITTYFTGAFPATCLVVAAPRLRFGGLGLTTCTRG